MFLSLYARAANGSHFNAHNLCCISPHTAVMNCHMLIIETFLMTVVARIYYRKKDAKIGYETHSSSEPDLKLKA